MMTRFVAVVKDWRGNEEVIAGKFDVALIFDKQGNSTGFLECKYSTREYGESCWYRLPIDSQGGVACFGFGVFMRDYAGRVLRFARC